jgi:3-methyladenine DNA glycosylase AlkD
MAKPHTPSLKPAEYVALIRERFTEAGDPLVAEGQMRYMRNQYAFCGLKAPQWVAILKDIFSAHGLYDGQMLKTFARLCFKEEYHEIFYAGLQMTEKQIKKQPKEFIDFLDEAIVTGGWWDTVDWVNKLVGIHVVRYPDLQYPTCENWISSENIWLQRVAIIHQLTYKESTDEKLLFRMILRRKGSKEFFVRKAAGWALRQYSRTNPEAVIRFIGKHQDLSPLTRREGLRLIAKE